VIEPAYVSASRSDGTRWSVPAGWEQGRGAWGGLVVAGLARATATHVSDPDRRLRAVSCQLLAPLPDGDATVHTEVLRTGTATSGVRADVRDAAGRLCATLTAVWGADRAPSVEPPYQQWAEVTVPDVTPWRDVPVVAIEPPLGPAFGSHLVFRPITGYPTSGSAHIHGWIGLPDIPDDWSWDGASLLGMVDAWWPSALSRMNEMRPMATVSFAAHLLCDPTTVASDEPLLHEGVLVGAQTGFSSEIRRLWSADGRLVVDSMQLVAIIA
jgi:hypothetical protein